MKTNYEIAGDIEREKLTAFFNVAGITSYTFTSSSSYDKVDAFFDKDGRQFVLEAKVRNCKVSTYPTHLLQQDKYEQLKKYGSEGYIPLYVNFFQDGMIVYNISNRIKLDAAGQEPIKFVSQKCRTNTVNNGQAIQRHCTMLRVDETKFMDKKYDSQF